MAEELIAPHERVDTMVEGIPDLTLGWEALAFAATYLRHPDGDRAGERWEFTPRQARWILWWYAVDENGDWLYGQGSRRLGKGPIVHSEMVPTPSGWKRHGDLKMYDQVYAVDGSVTTVVDLGQEVDEDCYDVVFRDGTSVRCTGSHRWPVETFTGRSKRTSEIVTVRDMLDNGLVFSRALTKGKTKAKSGNVSRYKTLVSPSVQGEHMDLPIDPYLLGYWLGDGDSDCGRITCGEDDLPHLLGEIISSGNEHFPPTRTNTARRVTVKGLKGALRSLDLLHNKHIPDVYLRASMEQRFALLQGLMDSDGTVSKRGACEISMMQGRLRGDILELCHSLGLMPTVTDSPAALKGRVVGERFRIRFTPLANERVCRLPRKLERCKRERVHSVPFGRCRTIVDIRPVESETARCITVAHPSHQYLVGEGWVPTCNSGKSPWAAVMAIIELLAPVRFDHFDPNVPGGCIGKRVSMPLVQLAANSFDQVKNTYSIVRAMLSPSMAPKLHADFNLDVGAERVYVEPSGSLQIISSSSASAEGARSTFVICDETEWWTPSSGGVDFFNTLKANSTKTGSRVVETCNAWRPDEGSVAELNFKAWCAQEEGTEREIKRKILYESVMAPPDTDIADEDSLRKALEFVYDDNPWSLKHLDAIISDIYTSSTPIEASKRKYLNIPTTAEDAWADPQQWALMADRSRKVEPGEDIVMFFDGSLSNDATALIGCCVSDGHVFTIGIWEPGNDHDKKHKINVQAVDGRVEKAFATYNVRAFFADVREWENAVKVSWPERFGAQLDVWATPRGEIPEPIAWDMRGKKKDFTLACELTEGDILNGAFTHDGNPVLARHVANARRFENHFGIAISKESRSSPNKIDAAVCMIGARHALRVLKENADTPATYEAVFY